MHGQQAERPAPPGATAVNRDYPDRPFVGVGVVVFRGDDVLLVQRGKPPRLNTWSIPGGAQHVGETAAEGALRELLEETSITAEIVGLIDVVDAITRDEAGRVRFHYTLVDYVAEWRAGTAMPGDDVAVCRWVPIAAAETYVAWPETRRVIRRAQAMRHAPGAPGPGARGAAVNES